MFNGCAHMISAIVLQVGVELMSWITIRRCYTWMTQVGVVDAGNTQLHM